MNYNGVNVGIQGLTHYHPPVSAKTSTPTTLKDLPQDTGLTVEVRATCFQGKRDNHRKT